MPAKAFRKGLETETDKDNRPKGISPGMYMVCIADKMVMGKSTCNLEVFHEKKHAAAVRVLVTKGVHSCSVAEKAAADEARSAANRVCILIDQTTSTIHRYTSKWARLQGDVLEGNARDESGALEGKIVSAKLPVFDEDGSFRAMYEGKASVGALNENGKHELSFAFGGAQHTVELKQTAVAALPEWTEPEPNPEPETEAETELALVPISMAHFVNNKTILGIVGALPRSSETGEGSFDAHEIVSVLKAAGSYADKLPPVASDFAFMVALGVALSALQTNLSDAGALTAPRTWPTSGSQALAGAFKLALLARPKPTAQPPSDDYPLASSFLALADPHQSSSLLADLANLILPAADQPFASTRPLVQQQALNGALSSLGDFDTVRKIKEIGAPGTVAVDKLEAIFFRARSAAKQQPKSRELFPDQRQQQTAAAPSFYVSMPDNSGSALDLSHKRQLREDAYNAATTDEWQKLAASDPAQLHTSVSAPRDSDSGIKSDAIYRLLTSERDVDVAITGCAGPHIHRT